MVRNAALWLRQGIFVQLYSVPRFEKVEKEYKGICRARRRWDAEIRVQVHLTVKCGLHLVRNWCGWTLASNRCQSPNPSLLVADCLNNILGDFIKLGHETLIH